MQSRRTISDSFSTYIRFETDQFSGWLTEPRLKKSIEQALHHGSNPPCSNPQSTKPFWALYWYQHWQHKTHRLALMHLGAHVQESGYWAAYKFVSRFESQQFSLSDCFQIAFTQLEPGLSHFQPERGLPLESFAKLFFSSTITNTLRRAQEVDLCSDWLLLRKTSRKRLIESLKSAGLGEQAIQQRRLAWLCFNRLYTGKKDSGTRQLLAPTEAQWQVIANLYNREQPKQLTAPGKPITATQIQHQLADTIRRIRSYLNPKVISLNLPTLENEGSELQDRLPTDERPPLEQLIHHQTDTDRQAQQAQLRHFLAQSLAQLTSKDQSLMQLYYQAQLTQQKIAAKLEIKQYTVCRKLSKIRQKLLNGLLDWSEQQKTSQQNTPTQTPQQIEQTADLLELWLQDYFQKE